MRNKKTLKAKHSLVLPRRLLRLFLSLLWPVCSSCNLFLSMLLLLLLLALALALPACISHPKRSNFARNVRENKTHINLQNIKPFILFVC